MPPAAGHPARHRRDWPPPGGPPCPTDVGPMGRWALRCGSRAAIGWPPQSGRRRCRHDAPTPRPATSLPPHPAPPVPASPHSCWLRGTCSRHGPHGPPDGSRPPPGTVRTAGQPRQSAPRSPDALPDPASGSAGCRYGAPARGASPRRPPWGPSVPAAVPPPVGRLRKPIPYGLAPPVPFPSRTTVGCSWASPPCAT